MMKLISVQCQGCGTISEAFIDTVSRAFKLYPLCQCVDVVHEEIITPPKIITTGNDGTARQGRGRGQWGA